MEMTFSRRASREFAYEGPIFYRLDDEEQLSRLPFEDGLSSVKVTFGEPRDVNGRNVLFYSARNNQLRELGRVRIGDE